MPLDTIRAQIKATLEAVTIPDGDSLSDAAQIHDYWRHSVSEKTILDFFKSSTNKIHTWLITRTDVEDKPLSQSQNYIRTHSVRIWGFYGLKDSAETSKTFDGIVDAVMDGLREELKLPGPLSGAALNAAALKAGQINEGKFAGMLSHSCQISFTVDEYIPPG